MCEFCCGQAVLGDLDMPALSLTFSLLAATACGREAANRGQVALTTAISLPDDWRDELAANTVSLKGPSVVRDLVDTLLLWLALPNQILVRPPCVVACCLRCQPA
jgi:hypothetical protein